LLLRSAEAKPRFFTSVLESKLPILSLDYKEEEEEITGLIY